MGGALGQQAVSPLPQNNQEQFSSFNSLDSVATVDKVPVVEVTLHVAMEGCEERRMEVDLVVC